MWKAYLNAISENAVPNDTVNVDIKFVHEGGKEFVKTYNIHAGSVKDLQSFKDIASAELDKLNGFDSVVELIKPLIGKEIK